MTENILFWISFVGTIIFIVRGIYSVVILKLSKNKEMTQSDFTIMMIVASLAMLFVSLSITNKQKLNGNFIPKNSYDTGHYEKFGDFIIHDKFLYDQDTVTFYIKTK